MWHDFESCLLTTHEREELTRWAQSRGRRLSGTTDSGAGRSHDILRDQAASAHQAATISRWKQQFEELGVDGLATQRKEAIRERRRPGTARVCRRVEQAPADGSTHWSVRKQAAAIGVTSRASDGFSRRTDPGSALPDETTSSHSLGPWLYLQEHRSIRLPNSLVGELERRILVFLLQETIADGQNFNVRSHEAPERIFWGANDGLAAHVEAGVHQHGAAGAFLKLSEQRAEIRAGILVHGLDAG
jgi:hypothetical protein